MAHTILVYSDSAKQLPELVTYANQLSDGGRITTLISDAGLVNAPFDYGASKVYLTEAKTADFDATSAASALLDVCNKEKPELVILPATKRGKETSARLAAKLDAPLGTECRSVAFVNGGVEVERMVFSGNGLATEILRGTPAVVTLQAGVVEPKTNPSRGEVEKLSVNIQPMTQTLEVRAKSEASAAKLEEAERIVAVGRGLQRKEDLELIKQLAELLHAAVGGSRPLAADLGWLSDDQWIGLSGHKVKPKLYVAIGISGQVQHIAGMRDAKIVVAINKDPNAPMASNSDYYIVGDLYKIVPELIKVLKQRV
ncbi:MAG: electron transfer flavoprotein subunit alpha/FixB family protein [Thermoprotei archaeon]